MRQKVITTFLWVSIAVMAMLWATSLDDCLPLFQCDHESPHLADGISEMKELQSSHGCTNWRVFPKKVLDNHELVP